MGIQAKPDSHQRYHVYYAAAEDCLFGVKFALQKNSNISHLSGNFMGDDAYSYGDELVGISQAKGHSNGSTIDEVMEQ